VPWFRALYEQHFDFTWRSLRHLGVPPALLDDALQELWLVVYRRRADFEGRAQLRTWLFGIAINIERNIRRVEQRRRGLPLEVEPESPWPDPARVHDNQEAWTQVLRFVETLDEIRRAVFVGCLIEELPAAEVAQATGLDLITVYNRVHALRRSFRRWVEQGEISR
jgi:RNA polymerase sigma-70 factor (ECF subfamily)